MVAVVKEEEEPSACGVGDLDLDSFSFAAFWLSSLSRRKWVNCSAFPSSSLNLVSLVLARIFSYSSLA